MALEQGLRIAMRVDAVSGVEQQTNGLAGAGHQAVDLVVGFDDGAHMVVKGHAYAKVGEPFGQRGDLPAVAAPFVIVQFRALRYRLEDAPVAAARRVGIDDEFAPLVPEHCEMGQDRIVLGLDLAFEAAIADDSAVAIVLICGGRTFFAGADITEFGGAAMEVDAMGKKGKNGKKGDKGYGKGCKDGKDDKKGDEGKVAKGEHYDEGKASKPAGKKDGKS